jgi:Domain of unknown function (DUF1963)
MTAFERGPELCLADAEAARLVPAYLIELLRYRHAPLIECNFSGAVRHQMLGAATAVQNAAEQHEDDVLLLQLDSDLGANWLWGDVGTLQFWIRPEDLASRRFDRVVMTMEGH